MNNRLENIGVVFGLRLLGFLLVLTAAVCLIYLVYSAVTPVSAGSASVFFLASLQLVLPLWFLLFLLAYPSLLVRLDQSGVRASPIAQSITWGDIDRVRVSSVPGASFMNKITLSSSTCTIGIYVGQYWRPEALARYLATHLEWVEEAQLRVPCDLLRPA